MSSKFFPVGNVSPTYPAFRTPSKVLISGSGLRSFWQASEITTRDGGIGALDWNGSAWASVAGLGGSTGGLEIYDEGKNEVNISKNGVCVAWDFKFNTPDTALFRGIDIKGINSRRVYPFVPINTSDPVSYDGTEISPFANRPLNDQYYSPRKIRFSDDGTRQFIYFQSGHNLIEVTGRPSLFFPSNGTYGNNLVTFEVSGDGLNIFVLIGGAIKLFSWSGSAWVFSRQWDNNSAQFCVNYDGSVIAVQTSSSVTVYKKDGNTWGQLGTVQESNPDGMPWVNSTGTLLNVASKLYFWNGTSWEYKGDTLGAISDDGSVAVLPAGAGSLQRYEAKSVPGVATGQSMTGKVGEPFSGQPTLFDSITATTWSLASSLPAGLIIDEFTGAITGTPTEKGTFTTNIIPYNDYEGIGNTIAFTIEAGFPLFFGAPRCTGVFAGGTQGTAVYYGLNKLWPL